MKGFRWYLFFCFVVLVFAISSGCASVIKRPAPLTVPQIVQLCKEGVPSSDIIDQMKQSGAVYRLNASRLARLKEEGVPDAIINYMQQTYLGEARREQREEDRRLWPGYWGPYEPW
jgi:hypothetical protein